MIDYLIRSGLVLTILLVIYHLMLENEKMHRFNRTFLLGSLFLGLTIPLITIVLPKIEIAERPVSLSNFVMPAFSDLGQASLNSVTNYDSFNVALATYCLIAGLLLLRFLINLSLILRTAWANPTENKNKGTIVLIKEKLVPHSFLYFIFLNQDDYVNNRIEKDIITHEFAHVRQKHSLDLLLTELLMVIFWFNPIFIFYKKAIQLNHEFLADEAVIESSCNISAYQQLLLQKATLKSVTLASNFNFSVTKKRIIMMKKQTSKLRRVMKALSLIPVAAILVLTFSNQMFAQGALAASELIVTFDQSAQLTKDEYYKGAYMRFVNKEGIKSRKRYEELTAEEKSYYPAPIQPTEQLMSRWRDANKFVVLIGFEKVKQPLSSYRAQDFVSYYSYKNDNQASTFIVLIKRDFLEKIKTLGGDFNREGNQIALTPPPPVIIPANKN